MIFGQSIVPFILAGIVLTWMIKKSHNSVSRVIMKMHAQLVKQKPQVSKFMTMILNQSAVHQLSNLAQIHEI
jgi:hypothetical protein